VLRAGVLSAAVVGISGAAGLPSALSSVGPVRFRRSMFAPYVGFPFQLVSGLRSYTARLAAVTDQNRITAGSEMRFSLLFQMAAADLPPEGIYSVRRTGLRSVDLFLAPVTGKRGRYEAVISA
jgi:hypothetical protein